MNFGAVIASRSRTGAAGDVWGRLTEDQVLPLSVLVLSIAGPGVQAPDPKKKECARQESNLLPCGPEF